ncbi:secondary thiamine-phosphate synthase enzyme YjbQ [Flavobacteriaceae bacterium]|jgi:secondary thiamine-phosphate synthase enzyme|nr:secondary thiamine-phosphate synthase enzyme YjbQ [Flavobacteriaceae bacterium]
MIFQKEIILPSFPRGFHLITNYIKKELPKMTGVVNIFIKHTSASLTINENADPTVRIDFETHFNDMVPETANHFLHTLEGSDDMTSHIKSSLLGSSVDIPINNGNLLLGTWQGIYLCEHRNEGGARQIVITVNGEE